ncbi:MAG: chemotaxis protein CheD [Armatimonadota bacterium]
MKHIVGVADMRVSHHAEELIVTHALGSCLGITIHDPVVNVGGMLHVMLPDSTIDPNKAREVPHMFVDTGVPRLFRECYALGAVKERLEVKVAGGACANSDEANDFFQIGKRNFLTLRKLLWKNGVLLKAHDVGGSMSRTMSIDVGTGLVVVKSEGKEKPL